MQVKLFEHMRMYVWVYRPFGPRIAVLIRAVPVRVYVSVFVCVGGMWTLPRIEKH